MLFSRPPLQSRDSSRMPDGDEHHLEGLFLAINSSQDVVCVCVCASSFSIRLFKKTHISQLFDSVLLRRRRFVTKKCRLQLYKQKDTIPPIPLLWQPTPSPSRSPHSCVFKKTQGIVQRIFPFFYAILLSIVTHTHTQCRFHFHRFPENGRCFVLLSEWTGYKTSGA